MHYKAGKAVRVHCLQADPDVAVLETANDSEGLWLPGVGLVALLFGCATLIWIVPAVAKLRGLLRPRFPQGRFGPVYESATNRQPKPHPPGRRPPSISRW